MLTSYLCWCRRQHVRGPFGSLRTSDCKTGHYYETSTNPDSALMCGAKPKDLAFGKRTAPASIKCSWALMQ